MRKIWVLLAVVAVGFSSCIDGAVNSNNGEDLQEVKGQTLELVKKSIRYFKDDRTGLCFAVSISRTYSSYFNHNITCVPCDSLKKIVVIEKFSY